MNDAMTTIFLGIWIIMPILLFRFHSRRGNYSGVFVYAYVMGLFLNHWFGAIVHMSPWNEFSNSADTISGFELSTYALIAFLIAAAVMPDSKAAGNKKRKLSSLSHLSDEAKAYYCARLFLIIGAVSWILSYTPLFNIASMSAFLSAGKQSLLLAICAYCWASWQHRRYKKFLFWVSTAFLLPIISVITLGFIGYGIAMMTTIALFIAMFFKPRAVLLFGLIGGTFLAVSFWTTYYPHREEIRAAVWGGEGYGERFDRISKVIEDFHFFDWSRTEDLTAVDDRLNQNHLIGAGIRTTPDIVPFENGATLIDALIALVPRILWPEKPETGGSGSFVSRHTMISFAEGTSVGMGQVFEFYINFGTPGVIVGFFVLGAAFRLLDLRIIGALADNDFEALQTNFLLGTAAMQVGGSMSEVVGAVAGGAIFSRLISYYLERKFSGIRLVSSGASVSRPW